MAFQYHVREMTAETSAEEFVTRFVRVERFLPFCQQCGSYDTRWTCPPFDFDPMTIWQSYTGLRLYARILQADVPEQPLDEAVAALKQEKRLYRQELQRWERETPGSQMLLAGTCDQCETCEKVQGHPCGRPELLRYSIEALGGDVEGCLQHYSERFKTILTQQTELKAKRAELEQQQAEDAELTSHMELAADTLEQADTAIMKWDEYQIRALVESVRILSKDEVLVRLKSGIEKIEKI